MKDAVDAAEKIRQWEDHMWTNDVLEKQCETNLEKGLTTGAASKKLERDGPNALTQKDRVPKWQIFLKEQTGMFSLLLWVAGILCFIAYFIQEDKTDRSNLSLGIVLVVVVFITGCFSYYQTSNAADLMEDFKNFIPQKALVIRDGQESKIDAVGLVVGDIIKLKGGDAVPADVILLETNEMKVNNASLTGESEDLLRVVGKREKNIFESPNVAFFGTMCTGGTGKGVVFRTGDGTVIGRIANLSQSADKKQTPLSTEIERFIIIISSVAFVLGISFFGFGIYSGFDIVKNLVFAIGIIVANVPEGLLATVTVSLALTAQRMASKFVLVKNMESVETLGSTSCICSDKTGTLTQNRMTVSQIFCNGEVIDASVNIQVCKELKLKEKAKGIKEEESKVTDIGYNPSEPMFKTLVEAIALTTTSFFDYNPGDDVVRSGYIKEHKLKEGDLPANFADMTEAQKGKMNEFRAMLKEKEGQQYFIKRNVEGDASETGLVKFAMPILMSKYGGQFEDGLDGIRRHYPIIKLADGGDALIPFSSQIKFNAILRDMNTKDQNPADKANNITFFMKGAPERVLERCKTILVNGEDVEYDTDQKFQVAAANDRFGLMGERVLAFARCQLDPAVFKKNPTYQFDVKTWNTWKNVKEYNANVEGWFPMWDMTLLGLVSLNDPPRPKVDISVEKCRAAGIKVIMVTGDQPPTAAAIANKVNIIKNPKLEYAKLKAKYQDSGMSEEKAAEQAMDECESIVIHGDTLAAVNNAEDAMEDDEPEKGRQIMDWIRKPEVVFARTTPSQKLLIVDACQRLGHIVAVTGDGVNDSPAIKKADIGIAMGSGSDVAQNAADMLLLDDNFSSIVNGVEEGRLIFDNLKKSIAYTLSSNIPEISPFIFFMAIDIPQPLSTVLILCIDLGTDMVPAISFAYENPELDIMERYPRNGSRDHLVNTKLISFAYLQIGIVQASAGFFTYYYIMNDFGITPGATYQLASKEKGYVPANSDIYDPTADMTVPYAECKGNTWCISNKIKEAAGEEFDKPYSFDWITNTWNAVDLRLFFYGRDSSDWSDCRWKVGDDSVPSFFIYSNVSKNVICHTSEALFYAQTGYLVSIVCVQWSDLLICKTRNLSISQQGMINNRSNFALFFETALVAILCYAPFINEPLGTRMIPFPHFAVPSFSFFTIIIFYDESRKVLVRWGQKVSHDGRMKMDGWVAQNTLY